MPNWEGLGSLGGGLVTGRMGVVFQGKRYFDLPSLKASMRNALTPPRVETRITSNWDPDTKAYYDREGGRLTDEEARLYRAKQGPWMGVVNSPGLPKGAHPDGLWYDGAAKEFRVGEKMVSADEAERIAAHEKQAKKGEGEGRDRANEGNKKESEDKETEKAMSQAEIFTSLNVKDKLARYLLNFDHPRGGSKAKWFKEALGFSEKNIDDLAGQIIFDAKMAVGTERTLYGQKFAQIITIKGLNGRAADIKAIWIKDNDANIRLVTATPVKKK